MNFPAAIKLPLKLKWKYLPLKYPPPPVRQASALIHESGLLQKLTGI